MHITLLVGTVHGNATLVAQAIQMAADDAHTTITLLPMDGLDITVFDTPGVFLLCTSTTGVGDVPDNAQALYLSLDAQAKYLGHVRYGLIALGDSSYGDSFYGGGRRFDERLQDLGAKRLGDICVLDASDTMQPEEDAIAWFQQWLPLLA
jgi:MioC protein